MSVAVGEVLEGMPDPVHLHRAEDGSHVMILVGSRLLLECLRDREPDVLRFTTDTRIWPTNNQSERDLRPLKTQQKISGRLQSEDTTRDRLTIRSYITTATRNGTGALTALRDAITGTPWTPTPAPGGRGHFSPRLPQIRT